MLRPMTHRVYCVFFCLLPAVTASHLPNVALLGTASQSTTKMFGDAWRAIDGNRNPEWFDQSCTHTEKGTIGLIHWWRVLLPDMYKISSVSITNRNVIGYRLNNAEILIGNSLENNGIDNPRCAVISNIPDGATHSFDCRGMIGRLVVVYLTSTNIDTVLTLCEVEVYGEVVLAPSFNVEVMGRNLVVVERKLCWSDALFYCRDFYWDLLSIHSEEEQRELEKALTNFVPFQLTKHVWLGLRRYTMGDTWFWMSGDSMAYTHWEAKYVWQLTSNCGGMDTSAPFHWRDLPSDYHLHFICFKDPQKDTKKVDFFSSTRPLTQRVP